MGWALSSKEPAGWYQRLMIKFLPSLSWPHQTGGQTEQRLHVYQQQQEEEQHDNQAGSGQLPTFSSFLKEDLFI